MNLNQSLNEVFITFIKFAIIFGVYHFSKFSIRYSNKNETDPISTTEKIFSYVAALSLAMAAGWATTSFHKFNLSWAIIIAIAAVYGLYTEFSIDSRLSAEQRKKRRLELFVNKFKGDNKSEY